MLKSPHINSVRISMTGETSKYRYEEYVVMIAYILTVLYCSANCHCRFMPR